MEPLVLSLLELVCKDNENGYNKIISLLQQNNIITDINTDDLVTKKNIIKNAILNILDSTSNGSLELQPQLQPQLQLQQQPQLQLQPQPHELKLWDLFTLNRYNNYTEIGELGSGSYGRVYKTYHNFEHSFYAIKKIESVESVESVESKYQYGSKYQCGTIDKNIFREIQLFSKLEHPNIVRYYSSWFYNSTLYIQMELCDYTLRHYIDNLMNCDDILTRCKYFNDVIKGIQYLHNNDIIHRDIKPSNIMFKGGSIKICDFGLSRYIGNGTKNVTVSKKIAITNNVELILDDIFVNDDDDVGNGEDGEDGGNGEDGEDGDNGDNGEDGGNVNNIIFYDKGNKLSLGYITDKLSLTCDVGSSIYRAPELEREYKYYNNKIDVYSLGIIFIEMLLVKFNTQHEKYKYITAIVNNRKKPLPYLITNDYDDVIINMICKNHNKRISINDISIIYKDNKKVYNSVDNKKVYNSVDN